MKLYIANCTKQVHDFIYRVPEATGPRMQPIREGAQIQISGELLPDVVDSIVNHARTYGMIHIDEIDRAKPFSGLCYSVDKPISAAKIQKLMIHNQDVLEERAEDTLKATALANSKVLESGVERLARDAHRPIPAIGDLEISILEESPSGTPAKTNFFRDGKQSAGGIKVSSSAARGRRKA